MSSSRYCWLPHSMAALAYGAVKPSSRPVGSIAAQPLVLSVSFYSPAIPAMLATCPQPFSLKCRSAHHAVRDTLDVVGGKWKLVILSVLRERPYRFRELSRAIGISPSILSKELQELEMNQLVTRTVYNTSPLTVEYERTPHSDTLGEVIEAMRNWGNLHRETIVGRKRVEM